MAFFENLKGVLAAMVMGLTDGEWFVRLSCGVALLLMAGAVGWFINFVDTFRVTPVRVKAKLIKKDQSWLKLPKIPGIYNCCYRAGTGEEQVLFWADFGGRRTYWQSLKVGTKHTVVFVRGRFSGHVRVISCLGVIYRPARALLRWMERGRMNPFNIEFYFLG